MKKNYHVKEAVSLAWVDNVINLSQGEVYCIEDGLNNAYLIDFEGLHYGRVRRKWLIVVPEFANTWSSTLHAMFTDDEKIAKKFLEEYEKQQDSINYPNEPGYDPECGDYRYYPAVEGMFMKPLSQINMEELDRLLNKLGN